MSRAKEILRKVRKIEISTKRLVDGLITGSYHSVFRGNGIEFSEIREYHYGDDVRAIDWKVTARLNKPFIKEFIEERDLRVYFAIDFSASTNFGRVIEKRQKAVEAVASIGLSAVKNNDNIGLFIFTDKIESYVPARKGKRHALKILSIILSHNPESKKTDIKRSLASIAKIIKKRSVIFVLSDFFDSSSFIKPLEQLKKRHDVIAMRLLDARELMLPDVGLIQLEDEETGEQVLIDTSDPEFIDNYAKEVSERIRAVSTMFKRNRISLIDINTDQAIDVPLRKFFSRRR